MWFENPEEKGRARVIAAVWVFYVTNYIDRIAISFAGPSIMKSLSMDPGSFGLILSSFGIAYALAQLPGGWLTDRWGAKLLMVVGPILWALFTGATGLAASLTGFVIVRAGLGISEGISTAAPFKLFGENFSPLQRSKAISIAATGLALAPAFAAPIVGWLLQSHTWRTVFFAMMVPALLASLVNYFLIPSQPITATPSANLFQVGEHVAFGRILARPSLWLVSLSYFGFNIAFWGYLGWMPSYLVMQRRIDLHSIGALAGIPYVLAVLGLLSCGWLASGVLYHKRPQFLACCYLAAGLSLLLAFQAESLSLSLAGLSAAAFFLYGGLAPFGALVVDLSPEQHRGTYAAFVTAIGQTGGLIASTFVGFLVKIAGSFASGFAFMTAALCAGAICLIAMARLSPPKSALRA